MIIDTRIDKNIPSESFSKRGIPRRYVLLRMFLTIYRLLHSLHTSFVEIQY